MEENNAPETQNEGEERLITTILPDPNTIFRCHKCRAPLFKGSSIIPHENTKVRPFAGKRKEFGGDSCTSYFIEKPEWLDATKRRSDSILCPKCGYKVGHYNWVGAQCSCGEWVKPSFQMVISRLDDM